MRPHVAYTLHYFITRSVFFILPEVTLNAQNPCFLPREVFEPFSALTHEHPSLAHIDPTPGRVSKKDTAIKLRTDVVALGQLVDRNLHFGLLPAVYPHDMEAGMTVNKL